MANKLVALFLMSIVVLAAAAHMAQAHADLQKDFKVGVSAKDYYTACFMSCHQDCRASGHGNSKCEMKCDHTCEKEVLEAKLGGSSDVKVHL